MNMILDLDIKLVEVREPFVTVDFGGTRMHRHLEDVRRGAEGEGEDGEICRHVLQLVRDHHRDSAWYATVTFGEAREGKTVGFGLKGRDACIRAAEALKGKKSCSEARVVACGSKEEALMADISGPHAVVWCA